MSGREASDDEDYFRGREHDHCACGNLANACENWRGPGWQNPWTGRRLRERTATWKRVTRHCRYTEGREDESYGPPPTEDGKRSRRVLVEAVVSGPAALADGARAEAGSIDVPEIRYAGRGARRMRSERDTRSARDAPGARNAHPASNARSAKTARTYRAQIEELASRPKTLTRRDREHRIGATYWKRRRTPVYTKGGVLKGYS